MTFLRTDPTIPADATPTVACPRCEGPMRVYCVHGRLEAIEEPCRSRCDLTAAEWDTLTDRAHDTVVRALPDPRNVCGYTEAQR